MFDDVWNLQFSCHFRQIHIYSGVDFNRNYLKNCITRSYLMYFISAVYWNNFGVYDAGVILWKSLNSVNTWFFYTAVKCACRETFVNYKQKCCWMSPIFKPESLKMLFKIHYSNAQKTVWWWVFSMIRIQKFNELIWK